MTPKIQIGAHVRVTIDGQDYDGFVVGGQSLIREGDNLRDLGVRTKSPARVEAHIQILDLGATFRVARG